MGCCKNQEMEIINKTKMGRDEIFKRDNIKDA